MSGLLIVARWWVKGTLGLLLVVPAIAVQPKPVSFNAPDGQRIAADFYPPPAANRGDAPIVILLHMENSDRKAWEPLANPLHEAGFAVLALDLRGHGGSATTATRERIAAAAPELYKEMQHDLRGAYDWLAAQPNLDRARFALVGAGIGASVAAQYAAKDRSVDALVCLSPVLNRFGLDAAGDIHQVTGRKILLLATDDERDAPYTLKTRTEGAEVRIYNGKAHGTDMLGAVYEVEKEIARFLQSAVGDPTTTTVYGSIESNIYHPPESSWVKQISATNLRYYSSPPEAEARGLRPAKSKRPGETGQPERDGRRGPKKK